MDENELLADLAVADSAGDTELAQAIAGRIKALRAGPALGASHTNGDTAALSSHGGNPTSAGPEMGPGEALSRRFAQGVLGGYGDELGGAVHAALGSGGTMKDRYLTARDSERSKDDRAKEASPTGLGFAAETAGAMMNPLTKGKSLLAALASGAAFGYGNSRAKDLKGQALDTGIGMGLGAVGHGVGAGLGGGAKTAPGALKRAGVATGYRHLRARGGDISAKTPLSADDILAAYNEGAFRPGTTVHYAAKKLLEARQRLGKQVGRLEDEMAAAGVTGPERQALAKEFSDEAAVLKLNTSADDPRMTQMAREGEDLLSEVPKPPPAAPPPSPNSVPPTAPGGAANPMPPPQPVAAPPSRMTLSQALNKKRSAGDLAEKEFDRVRGQRSAMGEGKLKVWGKYKDATEREINSQGPQLAPDAHAKWAPANKQFSRVAKADQVAAEGAARASGRNLILNVPNMVGGATGVTGALLTGNPWLLAAPLVTHELRTRGGSVATSALLGGSKLMSKAAPGLDSDMAKQLLLSSLLVGGTDGGNQ